MLPTYTLAAVLAVLLVYVAAQGYGGQGARGAEGGRRGQQEQGPLSSRLVEGSDGPQGDNQYKARIYTEPEYYGYESVFPGGRANFKGYRATPLGGAGGAEGGRGNKENLQLARNDNRFDSESNARGRY